MIVTRTIKYHIRPSHIDYNLIKQQTDESRQIYNYANYILRQVYFSKSDKNKYSFDFINEYPQLTHLLVDYLTDDKQFSSLFSKIICEFSKLKCFSINQKIVQGIVRKLQADWQSYWKLLSKKKVKTYDKPINIPCYKKSFNLVEYNKQTISKKKLKDGYIGTTQMKQGVKICDKSLDYQSFRTYHKNGKFYLEVIYKKEMKPSIESDKVASIDLGVNNLMTVTFNYNKKPLIVIGDKLKSINQYFNKRISLLQSQLPLKKYTSNRIQALFSKRSIQLRNEIGFRLNRLIGILKNDNISKVIIGYNKEWKQNINLGKKTNQKFMCIPFYQIKAILEYKLQDNGILLVEQEESYTSKASYLNQDFIPTYPCDKKYKFSGTRLKNVYTTFDGIKIHSDVNGSLNIMRKANIKLLESLDYLKFKNIFVTDFI